MGERETVRPSPHPRRVAQAFLFPFFDPPFGRAERRAPWPIAGRGVRPPSRSQRAITRFVRSADQLADVRPGWCVEKAVMGTESIQGNRCVARPTWSGREDKDVFDFSIAWLLRC